MPREQLMILLVPIEQFIGWSLVFIPVVLGKINRVRVEEPIPDYKLFR